jgi:hypothetical protein
LARRRKFFDIVVSLSNHSLGSVDELRERRRCLLDYGKAPSDKQVTDTLRFRDLVD